ncbi:uncharacterized protein [Blastocystis hominis]|uniref:Uncharacterized protein n=1 Tax=Blastocystis hominis TaxID=12968 RepID=D8MAV7_BLAHO|nr:uncharacterized protein [Blastocystis hominis]CBK25196.2 unnamed protein product [Blastocystis hominis]|eukprot:XP_012899244.1 uncharacterized protein [Blastocystis hominis]
MDRSKESVKFRIPRYKIFLSLIIFYTFSYFYILFGPVSRVIDPNVVLLIEWADFSFIL